MNLLELTLQGGVLIGAILLLRLLGRYRLPGWTFRILWGVALARLLIPVALPFPWNVYAGLEHLADVGQTAQTAPGVQTPAEILGPSQGGVIPDVPALPTEPGQIPAPEAAPAAVEIPWLTILYLAGAAALALLFLVSYRRGVQMFRTAIPLTHPAVNQWRGQIPALRGVPIRRCDRIRSPLTYGLIRPVVLLPKGLDCDDTRELGYVLLHEGAHIRHRDAWWKLLLAAALCVHWFNPLVRRPRLRPGGPVRIRPHPVEVGGAAQRPAAPVQRPGDPDLERESDLYYEAEKTVGGRSGPGRHPGAGYHRGLRHRPRPRDSPAPETEDKGCVSQDIQSPISSGVQFPTDSSQTDEKPSAPVQTADPVTEPEEMPVQTPTEPQVPETETPDAQTEQTLAGKYHIPEGYIEDGTTFTVANDAEYEELTNYLYALDGDLNFKVYKKQDGSRQLEVYRRSTSAQAIQNEWMENGEYKKNKYGETYGSSLLEATVGYRPDLIAVIATDTGVSGFVESAAMNANAYPYEINNPEDAAAYMAWMKEQPAYYYYPVYDVDHEKIVGTFRETNEQSQYYVKSQEDRNFEIQTVTDMMKNQGYSDQEIQEYVQQMKANNAR